MTVVPDAKSLTVLVPNDNGVRALEHYRNVRAIVYDLSLRPKAGQEEAEVIVVGLIPVSQAIDYMRHLPRLKLIQTLSAGFEVWVGHLPRGVALSNARGAHGRSTAEWVAAMLLAHYRELGSFAEAQARKTWDPKVTDSLEGKHVAVIGAGDVALNIRRMIEPFGCHVSLVARRARYGILSMQEFRAIHPEQDVVVLALPLTRETRGIVNSTFLSRMKDGAILVNAGRGALVETKALLKEANTGRIKALLDVTDPEPLPQDHPLWTTLGITITPHVAGSTVGFGARSWRIAAEQIDLYARGQKPTNLVIEPASQ